jgi:hypothetical protein
VWRLKRENYNRSSGLLRQQQPTRSVQADMGLILLGLHALCPLLAEEGLHLGIYLPGTQGEAGHLGLFQRQRRLKWLSASLETL